MKLNIDHIIVVTQEVEIPDTCPSCEADLTSEGALLLNEYQDQYSNMSMHKFGKDTHWCVMEKVEGGGADVWVRSRRAIYNDDERKTADTEAKLIVELEGRDANTIKVGRLPENEYELDSDERLPVSGECFLSLSWQCGECHHDLLENNEVCFDMNNPKRTPPTGLLDLLKLDMKQDGNPEV